MTKRCVPSLLYIKLDMDLRIKTISSSLRARPKQGQLNTNSPKLLFGRWLFKLKAMFGPPLDTIFNIDKKGQFTLSGLSSDNTNKDMFLCVLSTEDGFIYSFGYTLDSYKHEVKGFVKLHLDGNRVFISKPKKTLQAAALSKANILFAEKCEELI